jgi:hypothetical protein
MKRSHIAFVVLVIAVLFAESNNPPNSNDEIFLYRAVEKVKPGHFPLNQGPIGTCVAFGHAAACDVLLAIDKIAGKSSKWLPASPESLYGGARNESKGRITGSRSDGSNGFAATRWLKEVGGVIYQQVYDKYDLSKYDTRRAKDWGAEGNGGSEDGRIIPGPFDKEATKHPIKGVALVKTLEELDVALKNGWPVTICSGQGFDNTRDQDGFCSARGSWAHCMVVLGKRNEGRKGYLILNSWGSTWVSGPKYKDQPDGSFYCEPATMARILRAGDSWALSNAEGFKPSILPFWLTNPNAEPPADVEPAPSIEDDRNSRVYRHQDGTYRFNEDDGRELKWMNGKWWDCSSNGCSIVTAA